MIINSLLPVLFLLFSTIDFIIINKYYHTPKKAQFREVSQFIIDNNSNNDVFVSTLTWYFPFFLNNDIVKTTLIDKSLDVYVNEMKQNAIIRNNFWYVNAHGNKYIASEETRNYLESNFEIEDEIEYVDAWAKHFV